MCDGKISHDSWVMVHEWHAEPHLSAGEGELSLPVHSVMIVNQGWGSCPRFLVNEQEAIHLLDAV